MAVILNTPNTVGQESTTVSITDEATFLVHGTIPFGGSIRAKSRKTGSASSWEYIDEVDIREPGPVTIRALDCDVKFEVTHVSTGMAATIED